MIVSCEGNCSKDVIRKIIAECQDRVIQQYENVHALMIKEAFLICHQLQNPARFGYDEAHELASRVMEIKLSIANISKLKKQLELTLGDENAFNRVQRSVIFTVKLAT